MLSQVCFERVILSELQVVGLDVVFDVVDRWISSLSKVFGSVLEFNTKNKPEHAEKVRNGHYDDD